MSTQKELLAVLDNMGLPACFVDSNRHYWFIRTQAGSYFDEFFLDGFVGIGHEDVPCVAESDRTAELMERIKDSHTQATRVLNQVYKFCNEVKKGDIVIIPSASSTKFAFGYVMDEQVYTENVSTEDIDEGKCPFTRRRKVEWITGISKSRVDSKLYTFFRNQQTLSQVDDYGEYIERALHVFYIRDNVAHFTLSVETPDCPNAFDIPMFMCGIREKLKKISRDMAGGLSCHDLKSRTNVQSPGLIEILGDPSTVAVCALIVVAVFGGSARASNLSVKTNGATGLLESILKHLRDMNELKLKAESLKIKNPTAPTRAIGFDVKHLIDNQPSGSQQPKCNNGTDNPSSTDHV